MDDAGGFEGNAQTLHILMKLEKRYSGDRRYDDVKRSLSSELKASETFQSRTDGLNITSRCLAAVLKYDAEIPSRRGEKFKKGYFAADQYHVLRLKRLVDGGFYQGRSYDPAPIKTIECDIMDLADDIAYSASDLEDCLKTETIDLSDFLAATDTRLRSIRTRVSRALKDDYRFVKKFWRSLSRDSAIPNVKEPYVSSRGPEKRADYFNWIEETITIEYLRGFVFSIFEEVLGISRMLEDFKGNQQADAEFLIENVLRTCERLSKDGHVRRRFFENYITECVEDVSICFCLRHLSSPLLICPR